MHGRVPLGREDAPTDGYGSDQHYRQASGSHVLQSGEDQGPNLRNPVGWSQFRASKGGPGA